MITNYHRHLVALAIIIILLVFLPNINGTSDRMKTTSIESRLESTTMKNHLYDTLEEENLINDYEEEIQRLIGDISKIYPHRRAAAFHAMRGKRSIRTA